MAVFQASWVPHPPHTQTPKHPGDVAPPAEPLHLTRGQLPFQAGKQSLGGRARGLG